MDDPKRPALSIVIPTLDEGGRIGPAIDALHGEADGLDLEIVVADGGSADSTLEEARARAVAVVESPPGRGVQLAAGADRAGGEWLLFLHADTRLAPGWPGAVRRFMDDPDNLYRAAAFTFRLDDDSPAARRLEALVAWRCRRLSLPYGDQGLLISREFYERLQGHAPLPLMEDVDIIRRIGRRRLSLLATETVTSARKYRRDGYLLRPLRNLLCLSLYFAGLPPRLIRRLYG